MMRPIALKSGKSGQHGRPYPCLTTTPSMTFATSSQQSVICFQHVVELFPLDDHDRVLLDLEQAAHRLLVDPVRFVLEPVDFHGMRVDRLLAGQRGQRRVQAIGRRRDGVRELARARPDVLDVVEPDELRRVVDGVHHVVEARRERVEVLAIERRDERPVQPLNRVVRQRIAPMLGILDGIDLAHVGRIGREQLLEQPRGRLDLVCHLVEQVEELLVFGKQPEAKRHWHLFRLGRLGDCNVNVTSGSFVTDI